jgi:hypothetical protein
MAPETNDLDRPGWPWMAARIEPALSERGSDKIGGLKMKRFLILLRSGAIWDAKIHSVTRKVTPMSETAVVLRYAETINSMKKTFRQFWPRNAGTLRAFLCDRAHHLGLHSQ